MASVGSLYSGSPESKGTLYTPENGPFDNFFNLTTPSDLRLSPSDDSYAEWKALPSRLLESPPPNISSIRFHPQKPPFENIPESTQGSVTVEMGNTFGMQNHPAIGLVESFTPVTDCSSPRAAIVRNYLEGPNTDKKSAQLNQVPNHILYRPSKHLLDWSLEPADSPATSTRHLRICNIPPTTPLVTLYETFQEFGDIQEFYTQKIHHEGFCVVSYFDIRDSMTAYRKIQAEHLLTIQYCPSGYVTMLVMGNNLSVQGADNRPDVMCIVTFGGHTSNTLRMLYYVLSDFGAISKFTALENSCPPAFLITFFDTCNAFDIIDTLDGQYIEGFRLTLSFYDSDILTWDPACSALRTRRDEKGRVHISPSHDNGMGIFSPQIIEPDTGQPCRRDSSSSIDSGFSVGHESEKFIETIYSGGYVTQKRSTTNLKRNPINIRHLPSTSQLDQGQFQDVFSYLPSNARETDIKARDIIMASTPMGFKFQLLDNEISPKSSSERLHNQAQVPGKNMIDLERIARGLDTRTTVMLRNIPNKVDQKTLKDYVDTTSRGLYNFLYLRIDFRNICNVGYAFINFIDPLDIIDFVKAKSGTRWNKFNSEKVLDVTYANIQGIDQLVEKFRNSSVMDQDPSYRPKLFHSSGPLAGTEKDFPPANNILKKCRSISAAQQIGLFAPKMSASGKGVWRKRE